MRRIFTLVDAVDQAVAVDLLQDLVREAAHPAAPCCPAISAQSLCRADATLSNPDG